MTSLSAEPKSRGRVGIHAPALAVAVVVGLLVAGRVWLSLQEFRTAPPPRLAPVRGDLMYPVGDMLNWTCGSYDPHAWGYVRQERGVLVARCMAADGVNYHFEVYQAGHSLEEGQLYTLRFVARSDRPFIVGVLGTVDTGDSHYVGLSQHVALGTDWRVYRCTFRATNVLPGRVLVPRFALGYRPGTVWLADVALYKAGDKP